MAGFTLKAVRGIEGEVTIPALGATIGTFAKWTLTRSEDGRSNESEYVLRGAFSYFNPVLWEDESLQKRVTIRLGRNGTQYLLVQKPDRRTVLEGSSIIMEGITLWPVEQQ
jgi:hypothetical protein